MKPGYFGINFDLKSGYHHLDIFPDHKQYLSFAWIFPNGRERSFMFNVNAIWIIFRSLYFY